MTLPRLRPLVSLAAAAAATLAVGACAGSPSRTGPSRAAWDESAAVRAHPPTVRFDNAANAPVHVYLVTPQREWLLGRVEAGALTTLRIPPAALAGAPGFVRLAVLEGARMTAQAARDPRAAFTIAQPASAFAIQRWTFAHGQLTPLRLAGARPGARGR